MYFLFSKQNGYTANKHGQRRVSIWLWSLSFSFFCGYPLLFFFQFRLIDGFGGEERSLKGQLLKN
jgi:hypothetical protein